MDLIVRKDILDTLDTDYFGNMKPETKEKILDYIAWGITIAVAVAFLWAISNTFDNLFN